MKNMEYPAHPTITSTVGGVTFVKLIVGFTLVVLLFSCTLDQKEREEKFPGSEQEKGLFEPLDSTRTGIRFFNLLHESEEYNYLHYYYLYNGSGVAVGDINNDGLQDIFFSGIMTHNRLYLNKGNFVFEDISLQSGITGGAGIKTGVTMADVNQDGLLDIYVCKSALDDPEYRRNELYINQGNLTFAEKSREYGLDDPSYSTQGYFFDCDKDGDPDLFLVNHRPDLDKADNLDIVQGAGGKLELAVQKDFTFQSNRLYRNDGGRFTDITTQAGLLSHAFGLSASLIDVNEDDLVDIYVCNDFVSPDALYVNNGDGTFSDRFDDFFAHSSFSSMGSDVADINNDGCMDLMTLDMVPEENYRKKMLSMVQNYTKYQTMIDVGLKSQFSANALHLNQCNGRFSDVAHMTGTAATDWSWSVLMDDFNNDTQCDIFITNGFYRDLTNNDYRLYMLDSLNKLYIQGKITLLDWLEQIPSVKMSSYFFRNNGNLSFSNVSSAWNSGAPGFSNASAVADLDNDGYLDLVVNRLNDCPFILRNTGKEKVKNHFLRIRLTDGRREQSLSSVRVYLPDGTMMRKVLQPIRGYMGRSEEVLHFGLGTHTIADSIQVQWYGGATETFRNITADQAITIKRGEGQLSGKVTVDQPLYSVSSVPTIRHEENAYIDFKREPLLHQKYSEEGPAVAYGDITGDGLTDIFVGGAAGIAGQVYVQESRFTFLPVSQPSLMADKAYEDNTAHFFDADGDRDLDLYVASGGNEFVGSDTLYRHRLYLNDGKGRFNRSVGALPYFLQSGGVVVSDDIDGDGDLDLFVGGRVSPGRCPELPVSYFLLNEKGVFTDVTQRWSSSVKHVGMVTDAVFTDLDNDGKKELILCGEWMPVTVLKWTGGKWADKTEELGLSKETGWWYSLAVDDINGDGFPDIIAGNMGLNGEICPSDTKPVTMWYNDFDRNGTIDPILCQFSGEKSYPVHMRDRLLEHIIPLRKKYIRHEPYANATFDDIFSRDQRKDAKVLTASTFEHSVFISQGGKSFSRMALPVMTQMSAVRSIQFTDADMDGRKEILLAGNFYGTDAQFGRYDASVGGLLKADNKGMITFIPSLRSGVVLPGNVRHLIPIADGRFLAIRNNDNALLLSHR